jgi:peptide deformylase
MAFRQIVPITDPSLGKPSTPVDLSNGITEEIKALAVDMLDTSREVGGAGMAAVQVGTPVRMFVMDLASVAGDTIVFINPEIVARSAGVIARKEGCLSMPGIAIFDIERPTQVTVNYTDITGTPRTYEADGFAAQCVQHEMDHLDGIRFYDHVSKLKRAMVLKQFAKRAAARAGRADELSAAADRLPREPLPGGVVRARLHPQP